MKPILSISPDYLQFIEELRARVISARVSAARAITHEAIQLYWISDRALWKNNSPIAGEIPSLKRWQRTCKRHFPECVDFPQTASGECGSFTRNMPPPHFWNSLFQK